MPKPGQQFNCDREKAAARRAEAMTMRVAGESITAIALKQQISPSTVARYIAQELKALNAKAVAGAEQLRALEAERMDFAARAIRTRVAKGDLAAVGLWVKICERRSRLYGLDLQPDAVESDKPGMTFIFQRVETPPPDSKHVENEAGPGAMTVASSMGGIRAVLPDAVSFNSNGAAGDESASLIPSGVSNEDSGTNSSDRERAAEAA